MYSIVCDRVRIKEIPLGVAIMFREYRRVEVRYRNYLFLH